MAFDIVAWLGLGAPTYPGFPASAFPFGNSLLP